LRQHPLPDRGQAQDGGHVLQGLPSLEFTQQSPTAKLTPYDAAPALQVSILALFKDILDNQAMLPKGPASKELINLIKYLLRQFFKEAEKSAFIVVEALFPKNRNQWQAHSTWVKDDANTSGSDTDQGRSRVKRVRFCVSADSCFRCDR
jgi:hypothetical protein